ncbi:MAG: diacylglycerol kinase family protein [Polyangiales bacterium]
MAIGVVFNPRAGANRRDPKAPERMKRMLGDHGVVSAPKSLDELSQCAEDFRKQGVQVLAIAGGDGTNHVTLTRFAAVYGDSPLPKLALLRGGTMNTVADSLRLPKGKPEGLLDRLLRKYLETPTIDTVEQWTLSVEGNLGFLWGLGVVPQFLQEYYETGAPSPKTAAITLAKGIGSTLVRGEMYRRLREGVRCEVTHDAGRWPEREWLTVTAGTIADIGLGFKPYHRAPKAPGFVHLLGIHTTPMGFVLDLPRIFKAQPMREEKAIDALVTEFTVRAKSAPLRYMIDGDVRTHDGDSMTVRIGRPVLIVR